MIYRTQIKKERMKERLCLLVNIMDPYKARQNVTEKMLLEEPEAQSHNSDM
jgi:hypothetical protein